MQHSSLRFLSALVAFLLRTETVPSKQLERNVTWMDGNKAGCHDEDAVLSQFNNCPTPFIGRALHDDRNTTELKCPEHSVLLVISIQPSQMNAANKGCKTRCPSVVFHENCQASNNTCSFKGSNVWDKQACRALKAEIKFVCFKARGSRSEGQELKRKGPIGPMFCSRLMMMTMTMHPQPLMMVASSSSSSFTGDPPLPPLPPLPPPPQQQRHLPPETRRSSSSSSTTMRLEEDRNVQFSSSNKDKLRKRAIKNINGSNFQSNSSADVTEIPGNSNDLTTTNASATHVVTEMMSTGSNLSSYHRETFLGRQISLWFSSINEPHLIRVFIKSNLEKFILYVIVFVCVGVMSVMGVVIYSLAYRIKRRRTYSVNANNNQQKPGKISYHTPDNWRTPDSGSSTGDDRTLHEEEVNVMDGTDSRHAMCSSVTETRSVREETRTSPSSNRPLNNSARGSTTLPSPPNSLIFERASPLAQNDAEEEKPGTPSRIQFAERLSS